MRRRDILQSGEYASIPHSLLRAPLSPPAKLVAMGLLDHLGEGQACCWPSIRRLAEMTCLSRSTVHRGITELCEAGWCIATRRGRGASYQMIVPPTGQSGVVTVPPTGQSGVATVPPTGHLHAGNVPPTGQSGREPGADCPYHGTMPPTTVPAAGQSQAATVPPTGQSRGPLSHDCPAGGTELSRQRDRTTEENQGTTPLAPQRGGTRNGGGDMDANHSGLPAVDLPEPDAVLEALATGYHQATGHRLPASWRRKAARLLADPAEAHLLAGVTAETWRGCEHWRQTAQNPLHPGIGTLLVYLRQRRSSTPPAASSSYGVTGPVRSISEMFWALPAAVQDRWLQAAAAKRPDVHPTAQRDLAARLWDAHRREAAGADSTEAQA